MTDKDLTGYADLIWSELFSKSNENKTRKEQIEMIKSRLVPFYSEAKQMGKNQILNHFKVEIENLSS